MLVLSRKPNESIIVGDDIRIVVLEVRGQRIKLGIEAPSHVSIFRDDVKLDDERHYSHATDTVGAH
jgi:carbon storage regulator